MAAQAQAAAATTPTLAGNFEVLLTDRGVPKEMQQIIANAGFTTVSMWGYVADDHKELRAFLTNAPFSLDPSAQDLAPAEIVRRRMLVAALLDVWDTCKVRGQERREVEAVQRAHGLPFTLPGGDLVTLRRKYEEVHGRIEDTFYPCDQLIERRLQQIEQQNITADQLQDTASRAEQSEDNVGTIVTKDGALRVQPNCKRIDLPLDSESLRRRFKILAVAWDLARAKNPEMGWLKTATPAAWEAHATYVLGDRVYGFKARGHDGREHYPEWRTVLDFEFAIRKEAVKLILYSGFDFARAMKEARDSVELMGVHFITPTLSYIASLVASRGATPQTGGGGQPKGGKQSGGSAGKGSSGDGLSGAARRIMNKYAKKGGKGSGKGKGAWHIRTSDGRPICFAYNSANERCRGNCGRVHACQICLGNHPAHQHGKGGAEDSGGAAGGSAAIAVS